MNFVHISISIHFIWLIWLSLQFYDHDVAIARIFGLVLPNDDDVNVKAHSGVLDGGNLDSLCDEEDRFQLHNSDSVVHSKDLVIVETEISTHESHQFNRNNKIRSTSSEVMRGDRLLSGNNHKEKIVLKDDRKPVRDSSRRVLENINNEDHVETKCFLMSYDNSTFVQNIGQSNVPNGIATFTLDFELMTDLYSSETSWSLFHQDEENKLIIDSKVDGIDLLQNTLQRFKYSCFVTLIESEGSTFSAVDMNKSKTCYTFKLSDSWGDGICCWGGLGFYALKLNENVPLVVSERFYAYLAETNFCLEYHDNGYIPDVDINKSLYPSRECISETCVCDSKPKLFSNSNNIDINYPDLSSLKIRTFANILTLSGTESLKDTNSPQYMAACWALNDDPYLAQYESIKTNEADAETRMMQRYVLAVHYFSTKPQNWSYDLKFLSSKSECEWFILNEDDETLGVLCDRNNNIISILFEKINIDGPLVDELSGLKSLEFIAFVKESKMNGTIPSSFGLLSELRYLNLEDAALVSTIPPELFNTIYMERLMISGTSISGTIPQSIGKMKELQVLRLRGNHLTGEIPEELYSLTQLRELIMFENSFSSTISSSIGHLNNLEKLHLNQNDLSGSLPSELGRLSRLKEMHLSNNEFTSTVPSSLKSLSDVDSMSLNGNRLEGEVPDALCKLHPLPDIKADCRNDIFPPDLKCSCCSYCVDSSPAWNGNCPDSKLKFVIDHVEDDYWFSSELLEWSITDTATKKQILGDGPYDKSSGLERVYEACTASADCLSLSMKSGAIGSIHQYPHFSSVGFETPYSIYWNDKLLLNETFASDISKPFVQPEILFQYDLAKNQVQIVSSCVETEMICGDTSERPTYQQRLFHNVAMRVSGMKSFDDVNSPQSKALCWIVNKEDLFHQSTEHTAVIRQFTQRYVLTLLHLTSVSGLFYDDEFPPLSHECEWKGVTCDNGKNTGGNKLLGAKNIMTSLSLSSAANQIIGGTLIAEIGSLSYLEILHMNQTGLEGPIPNAFSNLYSLRELDLSSNALNGTISDSFFNQLERLEFVNLSQNSMTGTIPSNIGHIHTVQINQNKFIGSLSVNTVNKFNLKYLDLSENQLGGTISLSLLKCVQIEYLNLANNFLVGTLEDNMFVELAELKYFNISLNNLKGTIPSLLQNSTNITHFDIQSNDFEGTIPLSITGMLKLKYLNLQGNKIGGSLPLELNNLEMMEILALSHNEFFGPISLQFNKLQRLNRLYLHANELSDEAPKPSRDMEIYITDCGDPPTSLRPVNCPDCTLCCNADGFCQNRSTSRMGPKAIAIVLIFSLIGVVFFVYKIKGRITNNRHIRKFFEENVNNWSASDLIGDKTVYHFFVTPNIYGWYTALFCALAQLFTLFLFVLAADSMNEESDVQYTVTCSKYSLECEETKSLSPFGYSIFTLLLCVWLLRDFVGSTKLLILAIWEKNIDFFFASMVILLVTFFSIHTSIYYNMALATKNTELIVNAVILLFVNELDERLFQLAERVNIEWVREVNESIVRESYHERNDLLLERSFHKVRKRMRSMLSIKKPNEPQIQSLQSDEGDVEYNISSNTHDKEVLSKNSQFSCESN